MLAVLSVSVWSVCSAGGRLVVENVGFATPESVEYYVAEDVYLVTNINGIPFDITKSPFAADGNGFISKISPDGRVLDLKWIDGTRSGTRLNAPKGAAIKDNILYVADLDEVQLFDLPSGKQKATVKINGSTFLNGITPGDGPYVYVTDSGWNEGFAPSGTDAVYKVSASGDYKTVVKDKGLSLPNGIISHGDDFTIATAGSHGIYRLDKKGQRHMLLAPPQGGDGLLAMDDGSFLFSSWSDSAIYRLHKNGDSSLVAEALDAPADLGFDSKRKRVLIPLFKQNKIVILPL
jgi:hypothetical protein